MNKTRAQGPSSKSGRARARESRDAFDSTENGIRDFAIGVRKRGCFDNKVEQSRAKFTNVKQGCGK